MQAWPSHLNSDRGPVHIPSACRGTPSHRGPLGYGSGSDRISGLHSRWQSFDVSNLFPPPAVRNRRRDAWRVDFETSADAINARSLTAACNHIIIILS